MNSPVAEFYREGEVAISTLVAQGGEVWEEPLTISRLPGVELGMRLHNAMAQMYNSVQEHVSANGRYKFGFAVLNPDATGDTRSHFATYSSSTDNEGNVLDEASRGLRFPDTRIIYNDAIGMGLTSGLSRAEKLHYRGTGSLLEWLPDGSARPSPIVSAYKEVVEREGLVPDIADSDSGGNVLMEAYFAIARRNSANAAVQNAPSRMKDHSVLKFELPKAMLLTENQNDESNIAASQDPLMYDGEIIKQFALNAKAGAAEYHAKDLHHKKSLDMLLWTSAIALSRGKRAGDPLVLDAVAAVRNNPGMRQIFIMGDKDPSLRSPDLEDRAADVLTRLSQKGSAQMRAVIVPGGSHKTHTYAPEFVEAIRQAALAA